MPDEPEPPTPFAKTFERLRKARGWSPAEVARRLHVYPTEVSRWRHGGGISIKNVRKVADLFEVDQVWLERLAGYGDSHTDPTIDTVKEELRFWRARYDEIMEKKVPWAMREAYMAACEVMADAFSQALAALNTPDAPPLNRSNGESGDKATDPSGGGLTLRYESPTSSYRNNNRALALASH